MSEYLLDADVLSFVLRGHSATLARFRTAARGGDRILISPLAYFEVRRGLLRAPASSLLRDLHVLAEELGVASIDRPALDQAADLWSRLADTGALIEDADLLTAAIAVVNGFTLITHNVLHFARVPGLQIEDWVA